MGFFVNAKCLATLWDSIQVYSCFSEGASNLFRGRIVSPAQSPFVQLLNVSEFASDLGTREARLPPIPNAGESALLSLSHLIPGEVFCLPLTEKLENSTRSPEASGSGLGSCLLLSLKPTQRLSLLIIPPGAVRGADSFLQKTISCSKIWHSHYFCGQASI